MHSLLWRAEITHGSGTVGTEAELSRERTGYYRSAPPARRRSNNLHSACCRRSPGLCPSLLCRQGHTHALHTRGGTPRGDRSAALPVAIKYLLTSLTLTYESTRFFIFILLKYTDGPRLVDVTYGYYSTGYTTVDPVDLSLYILLLNITYSKKIFLYFSC